MNDKLKRKAQKIIAVLAKCSNKKPEAVHEAVGYILAFEERLPSSEIRIGYIQQHLTETLAIASYLCENTMLQPKRNTSIKKERYNVINFFQICSRTRSYNFLIKFTYFFH